MRVVSLNCDSYGKSYCSLPTLMPYYYTNRYI